MENSNIWPNLALESGLSANLAQLITSTAQPYLPKLMETRMWANAECYGRPAEYSWRPLFNAAKFGWRPLLECRAVTKPRRETR